MKTLDEVIKRLEDDLHATEADSQLIMLFDRDVADAVHYLKEYRKLDSLDAVAFPEDDNPPLTWDELKQMEGKPVWIEGEHGFIWNHKSWVLIDTYDENDDLIICHGIDTGHYEFAIGKEDYGTDWQAYRKERE